MKSVLLADDHPIFRDGMRQALEEASDYMVVGEVSDGEACIAQAGLLSPDVIVADLNMPEKDGFEVAAWMRDNLPGCRLVVVSMYASMEFVQRAIDVGAAAFVTKEDTGVELVTALRESEKAFFMSSSAGRDEAFSAFDPAGRSQIAGLLAGLTRAELNVLDLVASSMTSQDISKELNISVRTVDTHRHNICEKLDLRGPNSLLQFALKNRSLIAEHHKP